MYYVINKLGKNISHNKNKKTTSW